MDNTEHMRRINLLTAAAIAGCFIACTGPKDSRLPAFKGDFDASCAEKVFTEVRLKGTSELHSMVIVKDGELVYEQYSPGQEPDYYHGLWSASKTFTATAIGFAVQEGLLKVDDRVISFFDESELPAERTPELDTLTVWNLLTMTPGFNEDIISKTEAGVIEHPAAYTLACGFKRAPGTIFEYNSMATYLLSAIITKLTGQTCEEYLTPRLFEPLGIRRHIWETSVEGYSMGGWGLHLTTRSLAKMGQFFAWKGAWNGRQLLDPFWFDQAMSVQVPTAHHKGKSEWLLGYGYQMWKCSTPDCYRLDGAWGQYCLIFPDKKAAVAVNTHVNDGNALVRLIQDYIYPAL